MQEEWKYVVGYEELYKVSNFGRIKNCKTGIITTTNCKKYQFVKLGNKTFQVYRLVAQAFIENPKNYPIVNHKDENPKNNRVDNLEWCSYWYNVNYGSGKDVRIKNIKKRLKENIGEFDVSNKSDAYVLRYHRIKNEILQNELAERMNVAENTVSRWENGIRKISDKNKSKLCEILGINLNYFNN